jgi:hypothetical protein
VESSKIKISLKTPLSNFKNVDEVKLRLITSLILNQNFGPTSDLKEELMEQELINYMTSSRTIIEDYLILTVNIESDYPEYAIEKIKEQLKNLTMDEKSLKRKINSNVASLVLNYENIIGVNNMIQEDILTFNKIIDNVKEHLEDIKLDEVLKVIKNIDKENMAITILNPKK